MHDILKQLLPVHMPVKLSDPPKQTGQRIHVHIQHKIPSAEHLLATVLWDAPDFKRSRGEKQDFVVMLDFP